MPFCADCKEEKEIGEFPRNRSDPRGHTSYCKPCHNVRTRTSVKKNHGNSRNYHLKARYGITEAQFDAKLAEQGGLCAICRLAEEAFHADHDHLTDEFRGVLCGSCNQGLGNFKDDPVRVEGALRYLKGGQ